MRGSRRSATAEPGVGERDHRERGVPDRRLARFEAPDAVLLDDERLDALEPLAHHRVVERVVPQAQGDQRVDPWRLDAAPRAVGLLAVDDPALGAGEGAAAQRLDRAALVDPQPAIEPSERARSERAPPTRRRASAGAELVEPERQAPPWP